MDTVTNSAYNVTEYITRDLKKGAIIPMGPLVLGLTAAAGSILANLLTITAIVSSRLNKHSTHILVANQSSCDLLVAVNTIATYVRAIYSHLLPLWLANVLRLANSVTMHSVIVISLGNSLLIGVDRFIATVSPFKYKSIATKKRVYYTIGLMWLAVIGVLSFPLVIHNINRKLDDWIINMMELTTIYPQGFPAFVGVLMCSLMVTNFILYFAIMVAFQRVSGRVESINATGQKSRKLTSTVAIVVMFTLVFYCPFVVYLMLPPAKGKADVVKRMLAQVALVLITFASYINNIIYPLRQRRYRDAYAKVFSCSKVNVQVEPASQKTTKSTPP
ncbi:hypothetical protein CAPTEDRAFT_191968 [Capitella teleta]|uniref:G-protein coupled receptors family 1 profile domain-containing protein n=1 Tax=Capitella teleta TaxID=283909 RepID=R7TFM0_CAPTE|nr:hypothetical protein CAPTEDRAFT_191968 [Capitella teleta]|eukprot:ELT90311.1 hypothetical protein CAPTEDRAFT_191968 [Capitella teleta]